MLVLLGTVQGEVIEMATQRPFVAMDTVGEVKKPLFWVVQFGNKAL